MTSPHLPVIVKRFALVVALVSSQSLSVAPVHARAAGAMPLGSGPVAARLLERGPGDDEGPQDSVLDADLIPEAQVPAAQSIGEELELVRVPVTLDLPTLLPLDVSYTVEAGSAQPAEHFQPVSGTLTFSGPLALVEYIDVPIQDNLYHTGPMTFTVRLVSQSSGNPLPDASTTIVTILDDEPAPSASIAAPGGGYTVSELATTAVVTVAVPFTSTLPISVAYTTQDNTARAGVDYQAVSGDVAIAPGQTEATVSVPILNNGAFTGDRFLTFQMQNQTPGVLGTPASAQVTIVDAQQQPSVQFESPAYNIARDVGTAPISVTLSTPSAFTVTVDYATSNGTALAGVDYSAIAGTLAFAPGEMIKALPVTILDSGVYIGDRVFSLSLNNPTQATLGDSLLASVSIRETNAWRLYMPQVYWRYDPFAEDEPNGTMATAKGPLLSGATYYGYYDANRVDQFGLDRDTWKVTLLAPGAVTVTVTGNDPGRQVKLLNASGVDVPGGFTGDPGQTATFAVNVTAAGTYYVRVFSSNQLNLAPYTLRVTHP